MLQCIDQPFLNVGSIKPGGKETEIRLTSVRQICHERFRQLFFALRLRDQRVSNKLQRIIPLAILDLKLFGILTLFSGLNPKSIASITFHFDRINFQILFVFIFKTGQRLYRWQLTANVTLHKYAPRKNICPLVCDAMS